MAIRANAQEQRVQRSPIIDMHIHAATLAEFGGGGPACTNQGRLTLRGWDPRRPLTPERLIACDSSVASSRTDALVMRETLDMLMRNNARAVTIGPPDRINAWHAALPTRVIRSVAFTDRSLTPEDYRRLYARGEFELFGEITAQYRGLLLSDSVYEPYFSLAEDLDIPVGVHLGEGPPGGAHFLGPTDSPSAYRVGLGNPLQLEPILIKHPRLRIYVMHFGSPFVDDMIAMLYSHPQLYVDIAQNDWGFPLDHFYSQLKRLVDAGFGERIMFGSDQMIWPRTIEIALKTINDAAFLTEQQKRDILYDNAARFLRFTEAKIARDYGREVPDTR